MSEPRVLLEWQFTPDYDDATPETYRLREGRCSGRPLVEWRNSAGDWMSDSTINWTDEATLDALVRHVRGLFASRERIAALEGALREIKSVAPEQEPAPPKGCNPDDHFYYGMECIRWMHGKAARAALGEEGTDGR